MNKFLTVILRNQFNLLYRCGYTYIPKTLFLEYDGKITEKVQDGLFKLFSKTTPFEYEEEYLVLEIEKKEVKLTDIQVTIREITKIYPLSQRAKTTLESRLDERIRFEKPAFEYLLQKIDHRNDQYQIKWGIKAVSTLCNISDQRVHEIIEHIGELNIHSGLENRKSNIKSEQYFGKDYWEYLLMYERYEYFPNTTIGYFYDSGQIFVRSIIKENSFAGSGFYEYLNNLHSENPNLKFHQIIEKFETEEAPQRFIEKNTFDNIKYYLVTVLFLRFKDEIRKNDNLHTVTFLNPEGINRFTNDPKTKESFEFAVILIGAFFGFNKFYDLYYDKLNLRFFKSPEELALNKIVEPKNDEKIPSSITQPNNNSSQSNNQMIINIIEDVFLTEEKVDIRELVRIIKERTNRNVTQGKIIDIIDHMPHLIVNKKIVQLKTSSDLKIDFGE